MVVSDSGRIASQGTIAYTTIGWNQTFSPICGIWKYSGSSRPFVSWSVVAIECACSANRTSASWR
jgi:hypothetical protein